MTTETREQASVDPLPPPGERLAGFTWIPTLYFVQGLPIIIVSAVSAVMYKDLGVANDKIALYTSLLYLPWVIKPLWSPFVDLIGTQRRWIIGAQLLIGLGLAAVAASLTTPAFFALSLGFFYVLAFGSATHDIAADGFYMAVLSKRTQAWFVGIRSTFFRLSMIAGQGGLVMLAGVLANPGDARTWLGGANLGFLATLLPSEPLSKAAAWSIVMFAAAGTYLTMAGYHAVFLPRPKPHRKPIGDMVGQIVETIATFFAKPAVVPGETDQVAFYGRRGIVVAMAFLLLFRFAEAQLVAVGKLFLMDPVEKGGLALSTTTVGWVYGVVGVVMLLVGGILGGFLAAEQGLRRWILPMALAINLPNAVFLLLALYPPTSLWVISAAIGLEQFGYGFGFTGYMVAMLHIARGEHETAHYALCTGFMAAGMMLPGMYAGTLQLAIGYEWFFTWILVATIPSFIVTILFRRYLTD